MVTEQGDIAEDVVMDSDDSDNEADELLQALATGKDVVRKRESDEPLDDTAITPKVLCADELIQNFEGIKPNYYYKTIEQSENCTHEVVAPMEFEDVTLAERKTEPAKTYPFELDIFQKRAIACIDNNQSVLVSAHTSAGKTVVALYAIALALKKKQRVIYTSPIKALSNQKYRELYKEFSDVGLMTGDVTINPDASCIVMTTEILRSMLYRGSSLMHEIGWVVFDEIHYMRDKERGVVWEETIIMLADTVHYVFLSATIPNARQFASWICALHKQPCHVVYTDYRPTPLQHFIYPVGSSGLYEVVGVNGVFNQTKFNEAMSFLSKGDSADATSRQGPRRVDPALENSVLTIIRTVRERDMLPCIVFSFSRKECEGYANTLRNIDFISDKDDKRNIGVIFRSAIECLSEEDQKLPQVQTVLPFLQRGIGVHHSGLLPILKEVIEILFGEGLIKVLFATETFAMGLNMPARTVIFTSVRKFDGKDHRWITGGEYIQMSGRAGRRGKDDRGIVIMMVDQALSSDIAKSLIKGNADPLNSQFRLTYNMILNLLRVEGVEPDFILKKSFYHFQNQMALPSMYQKIQAKVKEINDFKIDREMELLGVYELEKNIKLKTDKIRKTVMLPGNCVKFLMCGRVVRVNYDGLDFGHGVVLEVKRQVLETGDYKYTVCVVLRIDASSSSKNGPNSVERILPPKNGPKSATSCEIISISLEHISMICLAKMKVPENVPKSADARSSLMNAIKEAGKRCDSALKELDPISCMKIEDKEFLEDNKMLREYQARYDLLEFRKDKHFTELYNKYKKKCDLKVELYGMQQEFKKAHSESLLAELEARKRVLRRLEYCQEGDIITQKGRVACEISAADELLLTELIFTNVFRDMDSATSAALLSCFICQEKGNVSKLADELSGCLRTMQEHARHIGKITQDCRLELDVDEYVESFRPQMMDVVYNWIKGLSFKEICDNTDLFEGSIIRCLRRLEELLREMVGASRSIGNADMEKVFEDARTTLKRDIVFAASLYL